MSCKHPTMHRIPGTHEYIMTGCGICRSCRENFARMWGIRLYHESLLHKDSTFITLTYDNDHLPISDKGVPTLLKTEIPGFMKRLREFIYPMKVRYFGAGEYGDAGHRPHYHLAIYGLDLNNPVVFKDWQKQDQGYLVECKAWNKGLVHVGRLEEGSAFYVAGYALKKVMGKGAKDYYLDKGYIPPFALMSRRPGIGADFCAKYADSFLKHGNCVVNGKEVPLPRYYSNKIGWTDSPLYQQLMADHMAEAWERRQENTQTIDGLKSLVVDEFNRRQQQGWNDDFMERIKRGKL